MSAAHPRLPISLATLLALVLASTSPLTSQETTPRTESSDRFRVGISFGGTGFLGLVTEYEHEGWSGELTVGTITFRELSLAIAGKHYFSGGSLRPVLGLGFWSLSAWTDDGSGSVFILRAPIALDWTIAGGHAVGGEVGLNRALAVNRLDPEDDTPPSRRLVPFPGAYYRYGWDP